MKTDFNNPEEVLSALIGGLKITNKDLGRNEFFVLGQNKSYLHLVKNDGNEYPIGLLSHVPIGEWQIWSEPLEAKFKLGDYVYDKLNKRICYIYAEPTFENKIAQFLYPVFVGPWKGFVKESNVVDFNSIKNQL